MEQLTLYLVENLQYAHWILFFLLLLTGCCLPVSEDLLIIVGGALASQTSAEYGLVLFIFVFLGSYLSDWEAYWLGRYLGSRVHDSRWFQRFFSLKLLAKIKEFYAKYGVMTLFIGRFIPFGIRNALFVAAGMSRMHFGKFLISDGISCFLSSFFIFYLAYRFGQNYEVLAEYFGIGSSIALAICLLAALIFGIRRFRRQAPEIEKL
ncbi:MAG: putative rane protein [Chlamydiales bacterium]|jgi:membrane protein DedA with SNARE-associated domain|nr:putative rane protein [Chlamydiales bacterium]